MELKSSTPAEDVTFPNCLPVLFWEPHIQTHLGSPTETVLDQARRKHNDADDKHKEKMAETML
jgi:hypothetical protein